jgi:hypothetical protein
MFAKWIEAALIRAALISVTEPLAHVLAAAWWVLRTYM